MDNGELTHAELESYIQDFKKQKQKAVGIKNEAQNRFDTITALSELGESDVYAERSMKYDNALEGKLDKTDNAYSLQEQ